MASRYPISPVFDYCFSPIHIVDGDKNVVVPCGRCDGCRLHKANDWMQRLSQEIDDTPFPVFFSLTYSNKYLPKLRCEFTPDTPANGWRWISNHKDNIRATLKFDKDTGQYVPVDKIREDNIVIDYPYEPLEVKNFSDYSCIAYSSKRDIQLYNKLVRKLIDERFKDKSFDAKRFRYFTISEYGPTTFRPHYHSVYLFSDREVSEYFLEYLVYACWPMCDKIRITNYAHYCTSGNAGYVTQYINSITCLPKVYQDNKEIRPFRLASKNHAIGFGSFDAYEVSEEYLRGNDTYVKPIAKLGQRRVFRFPSGYINSVFPKCREYRKTTDFGKLGIYRMAYDLFTDYSRCRGCRECKYSSLYDCAYVRLHQDLCAQDLNATMKCYKYCMEFGCEPEHYLYVLDMVYYKKDMYALRLFYDYQSKLADNGKWFSIARLYNNFLDIKNWFLNGDDYHILVGNCFLESLSLEASDFDLYDNYKLAETSLDTSAYELEVSDILKDMVKTSKFNEQTGNAPTSV